MSYENYEAASQPTDIAEFYQRPVVDAYKDLDQVDAREPARIILFGENQDGTSLGLEVNEQGLPGRVGHDHEYAGSIFAPRLGVYERSADEASHGMFRYSNTEAANVTPYGSLMTPEDAANLASALTTEDTIASLSMHDKKDTSPSRAIAESTVALLEHGGMLDLATPRAELVDYIDASIVEKVDEAEQGLLDTVDDLIDWDD